MAYFIAPNARSTNPFGQELIWHITKENSFGQLDNLVKITLNGLSQQSPHSRLSFFELASCIHSHTTSLTAILN